MICYKDTPSSGHRIFASSFLSEMDSQDRPQTMLLESPPDFGQVGKDRSSPLTPLPAERPNDSTFDSTKLSPEPLRIVSKKRSTIPKINEDPWRTYEPGMQIFLGREVILARRREINAELVDVQKLQQTPAPAEPMLHFMNRISHPAFPTLKECFLHDDHMFLVWEPLELSVSQLLAVKCPVTEGELAAIVWPVSSAGMVGGGFLGSNATGSRGYTILARLRKGAGSAER
jgi:hypothetical protein